MTIFYYRWFLPPECLTGGPLSFQYTSDVDCFCFGIFIFELVTGSCPSEPLVEGGDPMRDVMLERHPIEDVEFDFPESNGQEDPRARSESFQHLNYLMHHRWNWASSQLMAVLPLVNNVVKFESINTSRKNLPLQKAAITNEQQF